MATPDWDPFDPACPTRQLLDRVGDKWTVLVVMALKDEPRRFKELRVRVGGISPKMLTQTLRSLERDGMVLRRVHATSPVAVSYELTPLGHRLLPLLVDLAAWAVDNMSSVLSARTAYDGQGPQGVEHRRGGSVG